MKFIPSHRVFLFESLSRPDVVAGIWAQNERRHKQCPRAHQEIFKLDVAGQVWQTSNNANVKALPRSRLLPPQQLTCAGDHGMGIHTQVFDIDSPTVANSVPQSGSYETGQPTAMALAAQVSRLTRECESYIAAIGNHGTCTLWDYGNTDGSCTSELSIPPFLDSEAGNLLGEVLCTGARAKQIDKFIPELDLHLLQIYMRQRDSPRIQQQAYELLHELDFEQSSREAQWRKYDKPTRLWIGNAPTSLQWKIKHEVISCLLLAQNYSGAEALVDSLAEDPLFQGMRQQCARSVSSQQQKRQLEHIRMTRPLVKIRNQKYKEAAFAVLAVIEHFPLDFLLGYILQYLTSKLRERGELSTSELLRLEKASQEVNKRYALRSTGSQSKFNEKNNIFVPPRGHQPFLGPYNSSWRPARVSDWQPRRLTKIPTPAEFLRFVARREPFILSMNSEDVHSSPTCTGGAVCGAADHCPPLLRALGWDNSCKWDAEYMCQHAGTEQVSLSVIGPDHDETIATVCGSPTNIRKPCDYCDYVKQVFKAGRTGKDVTRTVGYFDASSAATSTFTNNIVYGFPLNVLKNDIPIPQFLDRDNAFYRRRFESGYVDQSNPEIIDINLANVYFWMGAATEEKQETACCNGCGA